MPTCCLLFISSTLPVPLLHTISLLLAYQAVDLLGHVAFCLNYAKVDQGASTTLHVEITALNNYRWTVVFD